MDMGEVVFMVGDKVVVYYRNHSPLWHEAEVIEVRPKDKLRVLFEKLLQKSIVPASKVRLVSLAKAIQADYVDMQMKQLDELVMDTLNRVPDMARMIAKVATIDEDKRQDFIRSSEMKLSSKFYLKRKYWFEFYFPNFS